MRTRITFIILTLLAASSCTIEKQLYSKGFHVEFHKRQRPADSHNTNTDQPVNEIPEIDQVLTYPDSITDSPILQEKEEEIVSELTSEKISPTPNPVSIKSKIKIAAKRIRTGISIQTHFSESLMSKSLKENQKKLSSNNKSRDFDWGEFSEWMVIVGGVIGYIFLLASMPGVSFTQALVGVLIAVLVIVLLGLLISNAVGDYQYWFWSGR